MNNAKYASLLLDSDTIESLATQAANLRVHNLSGTTRVEHGDATLVIHADRRVLLGIPRGRWNLGYLDGPDVAESVRELLRIPPEVSPISRRMHPLEAF